MPTLREILDVLAGSAIPGHPNYIGPVVEAPGVERVIGPVPWDASRRANERTRVDTPPVVW